jgi:drug/metabolite transporter (DMT)-like permease
VLSYVAMLQLKLKTNTIGIIEAVASGIGFGLLGILVKAAFAAGFTPGEHLALRFLNGAVLLWIFNVLSLRGKAILPWRDGIVCILLGVFGYAVFSSCYFAALNGLSVSMAVLLLYTYPILVACGAWLFFRQRPDNRKLISLPIMLVGLFLLVWGEFNVSSTQALMFAVAAPVLYACYILFSSRFIDHINPVVAVAYIQTGAAVVLSMIYLDDLPRTLFLIENHWHLVSSVAVFCTVLPMLLFLRSLQKLPPSTVSMLSTTEPITGVIAAAVFLNEQLSAIQLVGAIVIVVVLIYSSRAKASSERH